MAGSRRTRLIALAAAAVGLGGAFLAARLELRSDWAELLPQGEPSVRQMRKVQARLPGSAALLVNIHSPDREANERFADALAARLRALPPSLVELAVSNVETEVSWLRAHKWLYAPLSELEQLYDRLQQEIARRKNPLLIEIDDDEPSVRELQQRLEAKAEAIPPGLRRGRLTTADGRTSTVVVIPPSGLFGERAGESLVAAVRRTIAELMPQGLEIGFSGEIESALEERAALESDLLWATLACVVLIGAAVWLFFGRLRAVVLMVIPSALGTVLAFAFAQRAFGYLNSSTAFLGSIIIGNGINFALIQMARYEEERRGGAHAEPALARSLGATLRATAVAALAASCAYGSLMVTRFRGFSQFGLIGGVGMLLSWGATIVVLPALLRLLDTNRPGKSRGPLQMRPLARLVGARPRLVLAIAGALTVLAVALVPRHLGEPFEYDFRRLRSARSESRSGESRWRAANDDLFGRSLSPVVLLAGTPKQAQEAAAAVLKADRMLPGSKLVGRVVTAADLVPEQQPEKIAILEAIRRLRDDKTFALLDADERAALDRSLPPPGLVPIRAADVPALLRRPLTERDGTFGRVALVLPDSHYSSWDGRDMLRLAERVGTIELSGGNVVQGAGKALVFADMIRAVVRDGPRAMALATAAVMLIVLVLARGVRGSLLVLFALGLGMLWTLGAVAALDMKLNFLNFVALPITVGIGVDYAINVYLRYRLEGRGKAPRALAATGGAVALCSATTIIGYGSLLFAENRALRSFGVVAILGELACLSAALLVVPALLEWRDRRIAAHQGVVAPVVADP